MKGPEWTNVVGKKQELPTFEQIANKPEQLMRFTAMAENVMRAGGGLADESDDLEIIIAPGLTRAVEAADRHLIISGLKKLSLNTSLASGAPKTPGAKPPEALTKLTGDESRALAPFFEKFSRATATLDAFQGKDRFTDVEVKSIVNWASQHSPELGGIMAQVGNRPDFFMRGLKTLAYAADPQAFTDLRFQLEAARHIAIKDLPMHKKLTELGKKHGVAVQDMLDAINSAPNAGAAREALRGLIAPSFGGGLGRGRIKSYFDSVRANVTLTSVDISLASFYSRREKRANVLGGGTGNGIAESILQLIQGSDDGSGTRVEGILERDFANEMIGAKGSPDYGSAQEGVRKAVESVRAVDDAKVLAALDTDVKRTAYGIDAAMWAERNNPDPALNTSDTISELFLDTYSEDANAGSGVDASKGLWHQVWSGVMSMFKGVFYTDVEKKKVMDKIKTMP